MAARFASPARVLVFLAMLGLLISGCASGGGSSGGVKTGVGISDGPNGKKFINVGILTPLTGPVAAPIGIPLTRGIETYFKYLNDTNALPGYLINFVERDTQYNPQLQVQKYNEIHNNVVMIAESLGTPTTFAIKDQATTDKMLVSAATLSSDLAREKYLILVGTPYRLQVENAFEYVVNKLGKAAPKTGIIYQNDDYGADGLKGYTESIAEYKLSDVGQKSFAVTDTDFTAQVAALKSQGAEYVFLTCTPTTAGKIIGTGAALGYTPRWILQSAAFSPLLLKNATLAPILEQHAWVVTQGAAWGDSTKPGMAEMLANVKKYAPDQQPDGYFEFGYTEAKITGEILKKAVANGDLTRDGLLTAFESLKNVDLGGLLPPANYGSSPDQRVPTRDSNVYSIDHTAPGGAKDLSGSITGSAATKSKF